MSLCSEFPLDASSDMGNAQEAESEIVQALRKAGVFVESVADVDPYNAAMAAKMAIDDMDGQLEIMSRLIAAWDMKNADEVDGCINEIRAAIFSQNLMRSSAITRTYSNN